MSRSSPSEYHPVEKLRLFTSPLAARRRRSTGISSQTRVRPGHDDRQGTLVRGGDPGDLKSPGDELAADDRGPDFKTYDEPTLLEIFYDLFFAANYNVFSDTQRVSSRSKFKAYVGYFCLLWITWFLVTLFDVRYVTDSIFSRLTRALQLGVLVGFVVVAPKFDSTGVEASFMRILMRRPRAGRQAFILAASRLCLALEYCSTVVHLRHFKRPYRFPICLQASFHAAAAIIYLGIGFSFKKDVPSRNFIAWYTVSGVEAVGCLLLSNISPILSLSKTHLMKRITLLTVMIMGDGIIQLAKDMVVIVRNPEAWDARTIGTITVAVAAIYSMFLIYFDWMRFTFHLPPVRQQLWAGLHMPFHLALVLHLWSFAQLLVWSKIYTKFRTIDPDLDQYESLGNATTQQIQNLMSAQVVEFFNFYMVEQSSIDYTMQAILNNISSIPDSFWPKLDDLYKSDTNLTFPQGSLDDFWHDRFIHASKTFSYTLINSIFSAFNIEVAKEGLASGDPDNTADSRFQLKIWEETQDFCFLELAISFISAGLTMALMALLAILSHTKPYKTWPLIRMSLILAMALAVGLTAVIWFNTEARQTFMQGPWVLPIIALVWVAILVLTHTNGAGVKRNAHLFSLTWWLRQQPVS